MEWCGRVGEVRELFRTDWIVGYHWVIPNIFSMPDRAGPVYYSPTFRFLKATWYFGIYRNRCVGGEEWFGLDIRRSPGHPFKPVRFSIGVMHADNVEHLTHRNQNCPSTENVFSIPEFLPTYKLLDCRDTFAPSNSLTVTCVLWPDVPPPEEATSSWCPESNVNSEDKGIENWKGKKFPYSEPSIKFENKEDENTRVKKLPSSGINMNSGDEEVETGREAEEDGPVLAPENESGNENTSAESVSTPDGYDGIVQEVSRGVEWQVDLPPRTPLWARLSPNFTFGGTKYHFILYSGGIESDDTFLGFLVNIGSDANAPLPIRWQMAVKETDFGGLRWTMSGRITLSQEYPQHVQEVIIKRAELERWLSSEARLTFVHHLNLGEVDTNEEVSTQTEFEEQFKLQLPEEENCIPNSIVRCFQQQEAFETSNGEFPHELPRRNKKHFIFAA